MILVELVEDKEREKEWSNWLIFRASQNGINYAFEVKESCQLHVPVYAFGVVFLRIFLFSIVE